MHAETFLVWLLLSSIVATILAIAVLILRTPAHRAFGARASMILWLAPALRLVLPPLGIGLFALPALNAERAAPASLPSEVVTTEYAPSIVATDPTVPTVSPEPLVETVYQAAPLALLSDYLPWLLLGLWVVGAVFMITDRAMSMAAWRRTILREEHASAGDGRLRYLLAEAAEMVGYDGPVRLVVSGGASSPQVFGLRHPIVAVPVDFGQRFAEEEQRLAFLHEVTHLVRGDLKTLAAAETLCALHWFNPILRACLPILRADQEAACDESVRAAGIGTAAYAGTLLRAAGRPATHSVPALTLNHDLKRRIEIMSHPLPRAWKRLLGTACVGTLAIGVATATQTGQDDPNFEPAPAEREDDANRADRKANAEEAREEREVNTWTFSSDDEGEERSVTIIGDGETHMVLLSDPFADLTPLRPEPPARAERARNAPRPPRPPRPMASGDASTSFRVVIKGDDGDRSDMTVSPGTRLETGNGTVVYVPDDAENAEDVEIEPRDADVRVYRTRSRASHGPDEEAMEAFSQEMEAWSEAFETEMEGFEEEMEAFGEEMGSWGEKMGAVGEAIGDLGDQCEDHRDRSDEPAILTALVEDTSEVVKAVCATGGSDRFASNEMSRFVRNADGLSAEERAYFEANRRDRGMRVTRR